MNKFKTCREILLLSYADNNISDEEFVPSYDCYRSKNQFSAINGTMFLIQKTWIQLTAKPNFELKLRQTFVALSEVRVSVEWLFGDIINFFRFLDYKKNLKIGLSSVGKMYLVCALLRNAITCLYGNQTTEFFDLEPPTLEDYFQ